jgi:hypothetical protein
MFLIKAGTIIQVQAPTTTNVFYWSRWIPYATKEDKFYDKHEVWDAIAVANGREDVPDWAKRNIMEFNKVVIQRAGKYALVNPKDIEFVD